MKKIVLLGATGSIGTQTLDVVQATGCAEILALTGHSNIDLLEKQVHAYHPRVVVVTDEAKAKVLRDRLFATNLPTKVLSGMEGIFEAVSMKDADCVVNALVGNVGLLPTLRAIQAGKDVALANKETLVTAGSLVMAVAKAANVSVLPIDSEHSAVFQCLQGNEGNAIRTLYLTASGGPFRGYTSHQLMHVTAADALKHPNWSMGAKITIDSATMMNKGLEVIEACCLFNLPPGKINVLIHPQSVIHSMVEYEDGAVMAQLGEPDMRVPIQYALTYPVRLPNSFPKIDFLTRSGLTFEAPDIDTFPCLRLAFDALRMGGTIPAVMNGANEVAVALFLAGKIRFTDIPALIESAMDAYTVTNVSELSVEAVLEADTWARSYTHKCAGNYEVVL